MTDLVFTVYGIPAAQGSLKHVGNGRLVPMSKRLGPWRRDFAAAAAQAMRDARLDSPICQPVALGVAFTLPRPKAHHRTGRYSHLLRESAPAFPSRVPDLDKLVRAACDAITVSGLWVDDALVVEVVASKVFAGCGVDALDRPGAVVRITTLAPTVCVAAGALSGGAA